MCVVLYRGLFFNIYYFFSNCLRGSSKVSGVAKSLHVAQFGLFNDFKGFLPIWGTDLLKLLFNSIALNAVVKAYKPCDHIQGKVPVMCGGILRPRLVFDGDEETEDV